MKKGTIVATLVFVALIVGAVLSTGRKPERGITRLSFATLDKAKVDGLELGAPGQKVELQRRNGEWVLANGRAADGSAIELALDTLGRIESSDLVSTSADRYAEYGVNEEAGTRVRAFADGKQVADVTIGRMGQGGSYVRAGEAVYEVGGLIPVVFTRPASAWQQLKLFQDGLEDVSRIELALAGAAPYALVREEGRWRIEDGSVVPAGFRFDEAAARNLASALVGLRAQEIVEEDPGAEATGLGEGAGDRIAFTGKDGARREVRLGVGRPDRAVYARVTGREELVALPEYMVRGVRKPAVELRDLGLMNFEAGRARKLEIRSGKSRLVLAKADAWQIESSTEKPAAGFALEPAKVEQRLTSLASARALRAATAAQGGGMGKGSGAITVTLDDGSTAELGFGAEVEDGGATLVLARGSLDAEVYLVAQAQRDSLLGGLSTLGQ